MNKSDSYNDSDSWIIKPYDKNDSNTSQYGYPVTLKVTSMNKDEMNALNFITNKIVNPTYIPHDKNLETTQNTNWQKFIDNKRNVVWNSYNNTNWASNKANPWQNNFNNSIYNKSIIQSTTTGTIKHYHHWTTSLVPVNQYNKNN